jgi:hypothetical protein
MSARDSSPWSKYRSLFQIPWSYRGVHSGSVEAEGNIRWLRLHRPHRRLARYPRNSRRENSYDFFDLNVRGTFEVFEAAASLGIDKIIFISTTSVRRPDTLYGRSKILAELIAENYRKHGNLNVITLRPRGFIPF